MVPDTASRLQKQKQKGSSAQHNQLKKIPLLLFKSKPLGSVCSFQSNSEAKISAPFIKK